MYDRERLLIKRHAELPPRSQWKTSFPVEAGLPRLHADVWISFSKVGWVQYTSKVNTVIVPTPFTPFSFS